MAARFDMSFSEFQAKFNWDADTISRSFLALRGVTVRSIVY